MGKFSDYLDDIKNQTDGLRTIVSDKSGVDCANLSIEGVAEVVKNISFDKEPVLQEKTATENGEVVADSGYDGLSKVIVNVPSEEPTLITKEITESGTYNASDDNADGYSSVVVNVQGGGAEDLTAELTAQDAALTNLESAVDKLPEPKDMLQKRVDEFGANYLFYRIDSKDVAFASSLKFNKPMQAYKMFESSKIEEVPQWDVSKIYDFREAFIYCSNLVSIYGWDLSGTATNRFGYGSMFSYAPNLTNVFLKNITGKDNLEIGSGTSWGHLLTDDSLINTAKELWDLTGSTSKKLTLSTPSNARFDAIYVKLIETTADMIANDEYITNKKPCVVCESTDEGAMTLREYVLSKNWTIA